MFSNEDDDGAIFAVALLTRTEVTLLGPGFTKLWPVEKTPCFGELLAAIDQADREHWRERDREADAPPQIILTHPA